MSKNENRLTAPVALGIASTVRDILSPGCARIGIGGSLRRRKQTVGDIEFVLIPKLERGPSTGQLFATEASRPIFKIVDKLAATPNFTYGHASKGDRYRKLIYGAGTIHEIGIDLFFTERETWGNIFAIRTGSANFSRLLVTPRNGENPDAGGAMPVGWRQQDAKLWNDRGEFVPCYEEADFFRALGVPCWKPIDRSEATLRAFLRRAVAC